MSRETGSGLSQAEHSLVASELLGPGEIDEAIARQLIFGGDLSTSVLEIAPIAEDQLEAVLARAERLPTSGPRPWRVSSEASRLLFERGIPALALEREVGVDHPIALVTGALTESQMDEAAAILGARPELRLCLEVRYLEAASIALSQPLEPRLLRLLGRLGRGSVDTMGPRPENRTRPLEAWPATLEPNATGNRESTTAPPPIDYEEVARKASAGAHASEKDATEVKPPSPLVAFRAALATAKSRDALVHAALGLCLEAFPFAACFAIQKGELRGLLAQARHEPSKEIRSIGIPLDLRSSFSRAVTDATPTVFRPKVLGLEGGVLEDLGRNSSADVALVPILVRKRPVLLLWLDLGPKATVVPDSIRLSSLVEPISQGLERLLLEKRQLSRLVSLAPKRSSFPPPPQPSALEAPPPPSFPPPEEPALAPQSEEATPDSPIDPPPPARRFAPSELPGATTEDIDQLLRTSIESVQPPSAFGRLIRTSHPPSSPDGDPSSPGTLKGFPKGTTKIGISEPPPRFPESPQPFAAAGFAPLKPRRSVRVDMRVSLVPERTISVGPVPAPESPPVPTGHVETIPGVSPAPPALSSPFSAGPVETVPGLAPDDSPRLSARTMVSSAPLFTAESALDEIPGPGEADSPPPIPSLRPSQLPPPDEYTAWISDLEAGDESVIERFVDGGEAAVAALMFVFPGRVSEPRTSSARASDCGAVPRVLVHLGRRSVPFLTIRSRDENPIVRRWATFTLGEIPCKDAAEVIASRLFDRVPDVRRAALASARRMSVDALARRALRAAVEAAALDRTLDGDTRAGAIEALVDIREYESIPSLLSLLEDDDKSVKRTAKWALTVLLRQDFGSDIEAWRSFWNEHRDEDRVEWLILALDHASADLRRAAGDELAGLTGQRFSFNPHANPNERRLAQSKYREWWAARGQTAL